MISPSRWLGWQGGLVCSNKVVVSFTGEVCQSCMRPLGLPEQESQTEWLKTIEVDSSQFQGTPGVPWLVAVSLQSRFIS